MWWVLAGTRFSVRTQASYCSPVEKYLMICHPTAFTQSSEFRAASHGGKGKSLHE